MLSMFPGCDPFESGQAHKDRTTGGPVRIGYCKLGRSMPLPRDKWGVVGGDDEPPLLLKDLATRNPDHEWVLVGKNSGEHPSEADLPDNVTNPWIEWGPAYKQFVQDLWAKNGKRQSPVPQWMRQAIIEWYDQNTLPVFRDLDALVIWLGQHGTSNSFIPMVGKDWPEVTNPQDAFVLYSSYIIRGTNAFRAADPLNREEIYLIADARNYHKARDTKWPLRQEIIGQFKQERATKHERYGDPRTPEETGFKATWEGTHVWKSKARMNYSRLEICGILPWHVDIHYSDDWNRPGHFGLFINEARAYVGENRRDAMAQYVMQLNPYFVHGKWSKESLEALGIDIQPAPAEVYYDKIRSVRCTFTTPSSGSGWATTKPWQAFGAGTVCFFHPAYDTQNNILGDAPEGLADWLRVKTPEELRKRVEYLNDPANIGTWTWLIQKQREHYDNAVRELRHVRAIEQRIFG